MIRDLFISVRTTAILWILTAVIYPLVIFAVGQVAFPFQSNGSLLLNEQGQVIGSTLIGQAFSRDDYFWSRPSAVNYSLGEDARPTGVSGASNLAPSNPDLIQRIQSEADRLRTAEVEPTADLLYSSGSGLDPHISPASAQAQLPRVAAARNLTPDGLQSLVEQNTTKRFLGIFGEPVVNTVTLNLTLDQLPNVQ